MSDSFGFSHAIDPAQLASGTIGETLTLAAPASVVASNYVAGVSGWAIKGDGSAEFSNVTVRGRVVTTGGYTVGYLDARADIVGTLPGAQVTFTAQDTGALNPETMEGKPAGIALSRQGPHMPNGAQDVQDFLLFRFRGTQFPSTAPLSGRPFLNFKSRNRDGTGAYQVDLGAQLVELYGCDINGNATPTALEISFDETDQASRVIVGNNAQVRLLVGARAPDSFSIAGSGNTGLAIYDRLAGLDPAHRWLLYNSADTLRLWWNGDRVKLNSTGDITAAASSADAAHLGLWGAGPGYARVGSAAWSASPNYGLIQASGDGTVYVSGPTVLLRANGNDPTREVNVNSGGLFATIVQNFTATAAAVGITPSNQIVKVASSVRYKQAIEPLEAPERVLAIEPITYSDRADDTGKRWAGALAEQVAGLGLAEFVAFDLEGRPDAIMYDRLAVALIPIVADLRRRLALIEGKHP